MNTKRDLKIKRICVCDLLPVLCTIKAYKAHKSRDETTR